MSEDHITGDGPVIAEPQFSPRLWGSRDLRPYYPDQVGLSEPIGEAWLTAPACPIRAPFATSAPGPPRVSTLAHWTTRVGPHRLRFGAGAALPRGPLEAEVSASAEPAGDREFPLLVKLLFTRAPLSVQVHPDDDYARARGLGRGKTEMWRVLAAEPGAKLAINLLPGVEMEEFAAACRQGRSAELLEWLPARAGDTFYLPAGTIHALGAGLTLCEVQQQSDNTFRLDDYGRLDSAGRPRALHLEDGLAAARPRTRGGRVADSEGEWLVASDYFRVSHRTLRPGESADLGAGARIVVALSPGLEVARPEGEAFSLPVAKAALLPAARGASLLRADETARDDSPRQAVIVG